MDLYTIITTHWRVSITSKHVCEFIQAGKRLNEKNLLLSQELRDQIYLTDKYRDEKEQQQIQLDMVSSYFRIILDQQLYLLHSSENSVTTSQETKENFSL